MSPNFFSVTVKYVQFLKEKKIGALHRKFTTKMRKKQFINNFLLTLVWKLAIFHYKKIFFSKTLSTPAIERFLEFVPDFVEIVPDGVLSL